MVVPARIVVLGFDSCDVGIVRDMAAAGKLPTFRRLLDGWAGARIENPYGLFVGAVWSSFTTARSPSLTGFYCWETVSPLTYERRLTTPREMVGRPFWHALSDAGKRVAVVDVPHRWTEGPLNGVEVVEYGCHDRHFGFHTTPPDLASEIVERVGLHPVFGIDAFAERQFAADDDVHRDGAHRTPEEERALILDMLEGIERKRRLSTWILGREKWDLFVSIFGESHAVGHQSWHLHDPLHPRYDAALVRELGDPVERVYAGLDRALADHLTLLSDDVTVLVLLSHGMGPHYSGTHLMDEVLERIDEADRGRSRGRPAVRLAKALWSRLPGSARAVLTPAVAAAVRRRLRRSPLVPGNYGDDVGARVRAGQRFFLEPNNSVYAGVRVNLRGREASGIVEPGADFERTCERLSRDLFALVNVDTGEPAVRSVEPTSLYHSRAPHDCLPDLLIGWNQTAAIGTVWSPKTGLVHSPDPIWRTGDHRADGFLLAAGPSIAAHADLGKIRMGDLGPTICALLGVELEDVDGGPASALVS